MIDLSFYFACLADARREEIAAIRKRTGNKRGDLSKSDRQELAAEMRKIENCGVPYWEEGPVMTLDERAELIVKEYEEVIDPCFLTGQREILHAIIVRHMREWSIAACKSAQNAPKYSQEYARHMREWSIAACK